MDLIINDDNLKNIDIDEFSIKVRVILVDENNQILIANYGNIILLPGGKVDEKESIYFAISRELREELKFLGTINYYQKDYPKINGILKNRLVKTYYFIGKYKDVKKDTQKLTEKEQKGNFKLELVSLDSLENIILSNKNNNPRNIYFQKELLSIMELYKCINEEETVKKLELK